MNLGLVYSATRQNKEAIEAFEQAIPPIVPALGNYLIALFKETPLLSAIAIVELLQTAKLIGSETFRYVEPLSIVGAFFLAMSLCGAAAISLAEAKYRRRSVP